MKISIKIIIFLIFALASVGIVLRNPIISFSKSRPLSVMPSAAHLKSYVKKIVEVRPFRTFSNIESLNKVANYINNEFNKYCPKVRFQKFGVDGKIYKNVICFFPGKLRKRIVVGAHYDVYGDQDGADDNASGIAGIIELSRILKANNNKIVHDIEIVAYTLEEPPYFRAEHMGSNIHAKSLRKEKIDVAFMISVEMIGYFNDENWSQRYPSPFLYVFYPIKGHFIALIGGIKEYWQGRKLKSSFSRSTKMPLYSLNAPAIIPGVDFSDHLNYWRYDYNGYMITDTSFYRNSNYHKSTDTIDNLNFENMAEVVRGLHGLVTSSYD